MSESTVSKITKVTGVCPAAQPHALAELVRRSSAPVWLVVHEEAQQADALAEDLALFHAASGGGIAPEIMLFPEAQTDNREMREAFNAASDRLAVLSRLRGRRSVGGGVPPPRGNAAKSGVRAPRLHASSLLILAIPAAPRL
ncbi:MAG: hypothetical protein HYV75_11480, partial [Opitutae bacterium]|nr:hypothetical protein [Opitutae bacterium]